MLKLKTQSVKQGKDSGWPSLPRVNPLMKLFSLEKKAPVLLYLRDHSPFETRFVIPEGGLI